MIKNIFVLFLSVFAIWANTLFAKNINDNYCKRSFAVIAKYYKIDKSILKTLSKIESKQSPFAMLVQIKKNSSNKLISFLKKYNLKYKHRRQIFSIYPKTQKEAIFAYRNLIKKRKKFGIYDYDLGIMQVNRGNFSYYNVNEEQYYIDCFRNIFLGTDILRKCYQNFRHSTSSIKNTIECYHRGASYEKIAKSNYTYFNRFFNAYISSSED